MIKIKNKLFIYYAFVVMAFILISCDIFPPQNKPLIITENDRIILFDRTDKQWDITHAVNKYNMKAEGFQFGLGPNAIRPINNPKYLNPGDEGYPENNNTLPIIGVNLYSQIRAYPLNVLSQHEIVNATYSGQPLAAAY